MHSPRRQINLRQAIFGNAGVVYGSDRGDSCESNVCKAKELGVKHVGVAPKDKRSGSASRNTFGRRAHANLSGS